MIGTRFIKGKYKQEEYEEAAHWCNSNNATIVDKGEYYEVVAIPLPTEEEQNKAAAATKKAELQNEASIMMLSVLAGGSLTEAQTAYTDKINEVPDNVAGYIPEVFPVWSGAGVQYEKDQRVQYNGVLYKVLTAHTSQESWKPDVSPSLFVKVISSISGEIPEWEQPSAENAYMKGDKVKYEGRIYESLIDNNVWKPDEYPAGWKEVTETITIL